MIVHLLKIIRAQFRSNLWILAELMVVFVALWIMTDYFITQYTLYHRPVGFETDRVYQAVVSLRSSDSPQFVVYPEDSEEPKQNFDRIVERIRQHPDVEAVALSMYSLPYSYSNSSNGLQKDSVEQFVRTYWVTPAYFQVFHITPAAGGLPEELEQRIQQPGLIISANLAETFFGRTNVVGEELMQGEDTLKIVGVTESVRNDEYNERLPYAWFSLIESPRDGIVPESTCIQMQITFRIRPNVETAGFEERFMKEMRRQLQAGNFWVSDVQRYNDIREQFLEKTSNSSGQQVISSVMLFLLVNVFLAVIGSFWFRVNRRKEELGLRMAMGSSRTGLLRFTITESLLLLTLAALPALFICGNLMYADLVSASAADERLLRFFEVSLITWLLLAFIIVLGVWYPAQKAARIAPADALRAE